MPLALCIGEKDLACMGLPIQYQLPAPPVTVCPTRFRDIAAGMILLLVQ